jgi:LGFP repeat
MELINILINSNFSTFHFLKGIEMTPIQKKYQELGGESSFLGISTSIEISAPNGIGIYQEFQHGMIYYSPDYGACVMNEPVTNKWKSASVAKTNSVVEKKITIRDYLGFPVSDTNEKDVCYFERGAILKGGNGTMVVVYGEMYLSYRKHGGVEGWIGLPLFDEFRYDDQIAASQYFKNADIYWKQDLGAFEVHGSIKDKYRPLIPMLGFPISDENSILKNGREIGRSSNFESGTIFWSGQSGAHEMHGMLLKAYLSAEFEGPAGILGFPTSDETNSKNDKYRFNNFQNGVLIFSMVDGGVRRISNLKVTITRLETDEDNDDLYVKSTSTLTSNQFQAIKVDKDFGEYSNQGTKTLNAQEGYIGDFKLRDGNSILSIFMKAWDIDDGLNFGDDEIASFTKNFDIETLWDASLKDLSNNNLQTWYNGPDGKFKAEFVIQNDSFSANPFDSDNFRKNLFWNIVNPRLTNFDTNLYAETFDDVESDDTTLWHSFNKLFYDSVYEDLGGKGTCFGVCLEAIYALLGRSASQEPISKYTLDSQRTHDIALRHAYQIGGSQYFYKAIKYITGKAWDPVRNFHESRDLFNSGNYGILCVQDTQNTKAHAVIPYKWDDSGPEWLIYVANPNTPFASFNNNLASDSFIKIDPVKNTFIYQHSATMTGQPIYWTGGKGYYNGGGLFMFPYCELSKVPSTPFGEVLMLLLAATYIIFAGDGEIDQISDSSEGKYYNNDGEVNTDNTARIRNLVPVQPLASPIDVFAYSEKSLSIKHTFDMFVKFKTTKAFFFKTDVAKGKMYHDGLKLGDFAGKFKNTYQAKESTQFITHIATSINSESFETDTNKSNFKLRINNDFINTELLKSKSGLLSFFKNNSLTFDVKGSKNGEFVLGFLNGKSKVIVTSNIDSGLVDQITLDSINLTGQAMTFKANENAIDKKIKITLISFDQKRMYELSNIAVSGGQTITLQHNDACKELILHNSNQEIYFDLKMYLNRVEKPFLFKESIKIDPTNVIHLEPVNWIELENRGPSDNPEIKLDVYDRLGGTMLSSRLI